MIQKPVVLDQDQVDSQIKIVIRDDDVKREKTFPKAYLYVFVDDYLVAKDYKALAKRDRYLDRFYCSFDKSLMVKHGKHRLKVKYETYRDSKPVVLYFERDVLLRPETVLTVSYNKEFKMEFSDR
jgi:hypothetical protein